MPTRPTNAALDELGSDQATAVLEVGLNGVVRHVSKEWLSITGIPPSVVTNRRISEFVVQGDPLIFDHAAEEMRQPGFHGGSVTICATVALPSPTRDASSFDPPDACEIEAQGILVNLGHASSDGDDVVWLVTRHTVRPQVSVHIPHKLASTTGFAIDVFAAFLEQLADAVRVQQSELVAPPQELCRLCERFVKSWWFERHHWLCAVEHKSENRIRNLLDSLAESRDHLEAQYRELLYASGSGTAANLGGAASAGNIYASRTVKHAVHVSSPLARSASPVLAPASETAEQVALRRLVERCDTVLELDPALVTVDMPKLMGSYSLGAHNADILSELRQWPPLDVPPTLRTMSTTVSTQIEQIVSQLTRYAKFIQYRRILWSEIETQVREAIAATIAAAESTDATVVIDQDTGSSSGTSDSNDSGDPILVDLMAEPNPEAAGASGTSAVSAVGATTSDAPETAASADAPTLVSQPSNSSIPRLNLNSELPDDGAVASEDDEEMRYLMNLKRQRNSSSRRSSKENTSSRSPLSSPHLSPKLWPSSPSRRHSRTLNNLNSGGHPAAVLRRLSAASVLSGSHKLETHDAIAPPPSIRDYEILKPISRGAYGVVYLARKRISSDLFAIKVLKKSDMVAKNQVTHIKHERKILISTASSPYVATLYYSFQSRDYLYLVLEYVPGGDVAMLLKTVGCLSESWAKQYLAEIIVAVDSLHTQSILHRDLKPDNLLIDGGGHLKLSDFGLSAIATKAASSTRSRTSSIASDFSARNGSGVLSVPTSPKNSKDTNGLRPSESPSSPSSPARASRTTSTSSVDIATNGRQKLLGTPDYLAPETIEGKSELTQAADWWSVGCIFFELVYGYPPFNDETPQRVFTNALRGDIRWPDLPADLDISEGAKEFIKSLLRTDPEERLGAGGSAEIINHPYLSDIDFAHLFETSPEYIPPEDPTLSTANFDDRGAHDCKLPAQETDLIYSLNHPSTNHSTGASPTAAGSAPALPNIPRASPTNYLPDSGSATDSDAGPSSAEYSASTESLAGYPFPKARALNSASNAQNSPLSPSSTYSVGVAGDAATLTNAKRPTEPLAATAASDSEKLTRSSMHSPSQSSVSVSPSMLHRPLARARGDSRTSESGDEFGNFTYRNLPVLERANNDVITKIRDEDRRLSFSGATSPLLSPHVPSSPVIAHSTLSLPSTSDFHSHDLRPASPVIFVAPPPAKPTPQYPQSSPSPSLNVASHSVSDPALSSFTTLPDRHTPLSTSSSSSSLTQLSQSGGDGLEKEAAILRNRRRQLRRSMLSRSTKNGSLDILVGSTRDVSACFAGLDCKLHVCTEASEVCLRANSAQLFDLILLDIPADSPLPASEVVRIIRGTVNPNRETPILQVIDPRASDKPLILPTVDLYDPSNLKRALKVFCNWPHPESNQ